MTQSLNSTALNRSETMFIEQNVDIEDRFVLNGDKLRVRSMTQDFREGFHTGAASDNIIVFHTRGPGVNRYEGSRRTGRIRQASNSTTIVPAAAENYWQADHIVDVLHLYMDETLLRSIWAEEARGDASRIELQDLMGVDDPFIASFANLVEAETKTNLPQSRMMIDSFDTMLALHLLRAYTDAPLNPAPTEGPGTADLQDKLVASARSFLHEHVDEEVCIADVAHHLSVSRFHLARVFKARTGQTMHQFLLDKRVEQACALLRDTNLSLAEIAYACGFASQSHMTTVFGKRKGTSPGRYRTKIRA